MKCGQHLTSDKMKKEERARECDAERVEIVDELFYVNGLHASAPCRDTYRLTQVPAQH